MTGLDLLRTAVKFVYRKWGLKGVAGMAVVGVVLYVVRRRALERFTGSEPT